MTLTDEYLVRYLDSELEEEERAMVDEAIERSPDIARRLDAMRRADRLFAVALDSINARPLPASIQAMLEPSGESPVSDEAEPAPGAQVIPFAARAPLPRPAWQLPLAAGLILAVGVGIGLQFGGGAPVGTDGWSSRSAARIGPGDPLHSALESLPSGQTASLDGEDGATVRPVMTFLTRDGKPCREFELTADALAARGLACRGNDTAWTTVVMAYGVAEAPGQADATYRPAFGDADAAVAAAADRLIEGDPLGSGDEEALIAKGWR